MIKTGHAQGAIAGNNVICLLEAADRVPAAFRSLYPLATATEAHGGPRQCCALPPEPVGIHRHFQGCVPPILDHAFRSQKMHIVHVVLPQMRPPETWKGRRATYFHEPLTALLPFYQSTDTTRLGLSISLRSIRVGDVDLRGRRAAHCRCAPSLFISLSLSVSVSLFLFLFLFLLLSLSLFF